MTNTKTRNRRKFTAKVTMEALQERKGMVSNEELSIRQQCVLPGLCLERHLHRSAVAQREAGVRLSMPLRNGR